MTSYDANVTRLAENLTELITSLQQDGTVGMSRDNLRQLVSTKGVTLPNIYSFNQAFTDALGHVTPLFPRFRVR